MRLLGTCWPRVAFPRDPRPHWPNHTRGWREARAEQASKSPALRPTEQPSFNRSKQALFVGPERSTRRWILIGGRLRCFVARQKRNRLNWPVRECFGVPRNRPQFSSPSWSQSSDNEGEGGGRSDPHMTTPEWFVLRPRSHRPVSSQPATTVPGDASRGQRANLCGSRRPGSASGCILGGTRDSEKGESPQVTHGTGGQVPWTHEKPEPERICKRIRVAPERVLPAQAPGQTPQPTSASFPLWLQHGPIRNLAGSFR